MEQQVAEWACEMGENVRVPTGEEIAEALFSSLVVVWYRLTDFQEGTLRLIAEELLPPGTVHPSRVVFSIQAAHTQNVGP